MGSEPELLEGWLFRPSFHPSKTSQMLPNTQCTFNTSLTFFTVSYINADMIYTFYVACIVSFKQKYRSKEGFQIQTLFKANKLFCLWVQDMTKIYMIYILDAQLTDRSRFMLAPCGDTLGSWWEQTQTKCLSQALKAYISMLALWSMDIIDRNRLKWKVKEEKDLGHSQKNQVELSAFGVKRRKNFSNVNCH